MKDNLISPDQAVKLLENPDTLLFDVRPREAFPYGHIEGAVSLPETSIDEEVAEEAIPDLDTPIIVYCQIGMHSRIATEKLVQYGYTNVNDLGGLENWPYGIVT